MLFSVKIKYALFNSRMSLLKKKVQYSYKSNNSLGFSLLKKTAPFFFRFNPKIVYTISIDRNNSRYLNITRIIFSVFLYLKKFRFLDILWTGKNIYAFQ